MMGKEFVRFVQVVGGLVDIDKFTVNAVWV